MFYFRTWGYLVFARIPNSKKKVFTRKAYGCFFIGYALNSKTCRFYDLINQVVIKSSDVNFFEDKFPFKSKNNKGFKI